MKRTLFFTMVLLGVALILAACGGGEAPTPVTIIETVEVPVEAEAGAVAEVPFAEEWAASAHADAEAEAFVHWDEDDPAEIPTSCAKCHSTTGYQAYLGADGSELGVIENAVPVGEVITCVACHNDGTVGKDSVVMPSGVEITGLGNESRCMECHQGRESTVSVDAAIEESGLGDDDVGEELGFRNVHYFPAAATKYGTVAKGGYEYDGKSYDAFFAHVEGYETCVECHSPHTLELQIEECSVCHTGVASAEDLRDVRMEGSLVDYDGDSDIDEGVYYEIAGLQEMLNQAIQTYAAEVAGTPTAYDSHSYPYFFIDTNADGEAGEDEANYGNKYASWTPRLLKAAYNYQLSQKDPGAYAHGGKYIIQLLYDSIEDLNSAVSDPVDLSNARRIDHGHFAGSEEAFRHWDGDDPAEVPGSCSKCHSADGIPVFHQDDTSVTVDPANGFQCATCHSDIETFARFEFEDVEFPSGAALDTGDLDSNLCMNCHQGRSSTNTVNASTAGKPKDSVDETLGFINIHYFAAGATLFGTDAKGGYEYDGKTYVGRFPHVNGFDTCIQCHDSHELEVKFEACSTCHTSVETAEDLHSIRMTATDYDGDGDTDEGIAAEIDAMREALYAGIQAYAANTAGVPIVYDSHAYPYFFIDTNANGEPDPGEGIYPNKYVSWTPRLMEAAYNFQYAAKDPGGFAHNSKYMMQLLFDSIQDIGGSTAGLTRPQ